MTESDLAQVMEQDHRALDAFVKRDPEPKKKLFSRRDDVTLANPLGPPARGWNQVEKTLERAASELREGEPSASSASRSMRPPTWRISSRSSGTEEMLAARTRSRRIRFG